VQYERACQTARGHLIDILSRLTDLQETSAAESHGPLLAGLRSECIDLLRNIDGFRGAMPSEARIAEIVKRAGGIGELLARALGSGPSIATSPASAGRRVLV
jgi:hypothetical protein